MQQNPQIEAITLAQARLVHEAMQGTFRQVISALKSRGEKNACAAVTEMAMEEDVRWKLVEDSVYFKRS